MDRLGSLPGVDQSMGADSGSWQQTAQAEVASRALLDSLGVVDQAIEGLHKMVAITGASNRIGTLLAYLDL